MQPLTEIEIYLSLLEWEEKYREVSIAINLNEYPMIKEKLRDISVFLDDSNMTVDLNEVIIKTAENLESENQRREAFNEELKNCPEILSGLFFEKFDILIRIIKYQINHYIKLNHRIISKILFTVIKLLNNIFPENDNIKNRLETYNSGQRIIEFREACHA